MSKVSVFKFDLSSFNEDINMVNQIIGSYLSSRGFSYNNEQACYMTATPAKQDNVENAALSVGASVAASVLTDGATAVSFNATQHGFEYEIDENVLTIKAYLIGKGGKSYIHSTFNNSKVGAIYYGDLKNNLFKVLNNYGIPLVTTDVEQINDGSGSRTAKVILGYFLVMVVIVIIIFAIAFR